MDKQLVLYAGSAPIQIKKAVFYAFENASRFELNKKRMHSKVKYGMQEAPDNGQIIL